MGRLLVRRGRPKVVELESHAEIGAQNLHQITLSTERQKNEESNFSDLVKGEGQKFKGFYKLNLECWRRAPKKTSAFI